MSARIMREYRPHDLPWTVRHPRFGDTWHATRKEAMSRANELDRLALESTAQELLEALKDAMEYIPATMQAPAQEAIAKAEGRT